MNNENKIQPFEIIRNKINVVKPPCCDRSLDTRLTTVHCT